jgi:membrane protease YdiL (CAAX protease family)
VALAVRLARADFADYLALRPFGRRDLLLGLGSVATYVAAVDLATWLTGRSIEPPFVTDTLRSAAAAEALPLFICAVILAAPLSEELVVRGFLFRGFAASSLGPAGAIVLASALWAALHLQYDSFFIGEVFGIGLILGWMRWRSGSTWLAVILHGVYNLIAVAQGLWLLRAAAHPAVARFGAPLL